MDWADVVPKIQTWARLVREGFEQYTGTPDLWNELDAGRKLLTGEYSNTPFTEDEQTEISSQTQQVKEFIKTTYELTAAQIAEVEERLDQAEQASHRMGRKDWLMLFNGAVFSLVLSDLIPSQGSPAHPLDDPAWPGPSVRPRRAAAIATGCRVRARGQRQLQVITLQSAQSTISWT